MGSKNWRTFWTSHAKVIFVYNLLKLKIYIRNVDNRGFCLTRNPLKAHGIPIFLCNNSIKHVTFVMTRRQKIQSILQRAVYCINLYFSLTDTVLIPVSPKQGGGQRGLHSSQKVSDNAPFFSKSTLNGLFFENIKS